MGLLLGPLQPSAVYLCSDADGRPAGGDSGTGRPSWTNALGGTHGWSPSSACQRARRAIDAACGTGAIRVVAGTGCGRARPRWLVLAVMAGARTRWPTQGTRTFAARSRRAVGAGLSSLAHGHYVLGMASQGTAGPAVTGAGTRGRAAIAARADRSALPVQQPTHQCTDDRRPAKTPGACAAARFSRQTLVPWRVDRSHCHGGGLDRLSPSSACFRRRLTVAVDAGNAGDVCAPPLQPLSRTLSLHGIVLTEGGTCGSRPAATARGCGSSPTICAIRTGLARGGTVCGAGQREIYARAARE